MLHSGIKLIVEKYNFMTLLLPSSFQFVPVLIIPSLVSEKQSLPSSTWMRLVRMSSSKIELPPKLRPNTYIHYLKHIKTSGQRVGIL